MPTEITGNENTSKVAEKSGAIHNRLAGTILRNGRSSPGWFANRAIVRAGATIARS